MIWGIVLILLGLATLIYMRKDFITQYETSKYFSKHLKRWQGISVGILIIVIGIAKIINNQ
ncbi:MAG: hypothetical protein Q8R22_05210 [Flavobacterium sp.]|uniref:hypothetical protein n=1 Tax=Flavobacterium sp. TaxID=239 RepID=UPI0027363FAA|nr:hypothetical protein [Flavobacterium sp.]MDP3680215.1 hypothetical protein [Flavobacterium sp.]MDZ4331590.1 hypothetical protein [Flavobacterium sp.]